MEVIIPQPLVLNNPKVIVYASFGKKITEPFEADRNNYDELRRTLEERFRRFNQLYFLDGRGTPNLIDNDTVLQNATNNSQQVRLFLTKTGFTKLDLESISLSSHWLSGMNSTDLSRYLSYLEVLHTIGFKSWRKNLKLLYNTDCDLGSTIESLTTGKKIQNKPKEKREKRARPQNLEKAERKRREKKFRLDQTSDIPNDADDEEKKKKEKREKNRQLRKVASEGYMDLDGSWPTNITTLFIDGNNLMFISDKLRQLTLKRKQNKVQQVLTHVASSFAKTRKLTTIVVFDFTPRTMQTIQLENGSSMSVVSAKPQFNTSDELLIHWSKEHPELTNTTAVVTADRALAGELIKSGVNVIKPMVWVRFAASELVGQSMDAKTWLDALADQEIDSY